MVRVTFIFKRNTPLPVELHHPKNKNTFRLDSTFSKAFFYSLEDAVYVIRNNQSFIKSYTIESWATGQK